MIRSWARASWFAALSAGVLLALTHVLDPKPDVFFTVDALIDELK